MEDWTFDMSTGRGLAAAVVARLDESSGKNVADAERPAVAMGEFVVDMLESLPSALRGVVDAETLDCYEKIGDHYARPIRRVVEKPMDEHVESVIIATAGDMLALISRQNSEESLPIPLEEGRMLGLIDELKGNFSEFGIRYATPRYLRHFERRQG